MRTLPKNQRAIDGAKHDAALGARQRLRIDGTDGLFLELTATNRVWRVYATDRATGKKVWSTIGSAISIPVARASDLAATRVSDVQTGAIAPTTGETFDQVIRAWIEQHGKIKKKSWKSDEGLYERHIEQRLGEKIARAITRQDVIAALNDIASAATPRQADACQAVISAALSWAWDEGKIENHPALRIRKRGAKVVRSRTFTDDEVRRIWNDLEALGDQQRDAIRLLLITGLRRSEIANLERAELQGNEEVIRIRAQRRKGWRIGMPQAPHEVPITPAMRAIFSRTHEGARGSQFVFPNRTQSSDGPLSADRLTSAFAERMRALKITDARLHDLRHHVKTALSKLGVPRDIADRLQDHASSRGAADGYDHHSYLPEKRRALELWERRLMEIVEGKSPSGLQW